MQSQMFKDIKTAAAVADKKKKGKKEDEKVVAGKDKKGAVATVGVKRDKPEEAAKVPKLKKNRKDRRKDIRKDKRRDIKKRIKEEKAKLH